MGARSQMLSGALRRVQMAKAAKMSIAWLCEHQAEFQIEQSEALARQRGDWMPWSIKPVGELMFLILALQRNGVEGRQTNVLKNFVRSEIEQFQWHALSAYDPSSATPLAMIFDFFSINKWRVPFEIEHFARLHKSGYFDGMDRVPYRTMDLNYSLWRMGLEPDFSTVSREFSETSFGLGVPIARYSIDDIYSLTHALFYLTDLGQKPLEGVIDAYTHTRLRRELLALTTVMVRADNVDVLGELLINWLFVGVAPKRADKVEWAIFNAGLERVLNAVTPSGAVASTRRGYARSREGKTAFHEIYHTTLVAAMLFSLVRAAQ